MGHGDLASTWTLRQGGKANFEGGIKRPVVRDIRQSKTWRVGREGVAELPPHRETRPWIKFTALSRSRGGHWRFKLGLVGAVLYESIGRFLTLADISHFKAGIEQRAIGYPSGARTWIADGLE